MREGRNGLVAKLVGQGLLLCRSGRLGRFFDPEWCLGRTLLRRNGLWLLSEVTLAKKHVYKLSTWEFGTGFQNRFMHFHSIESLSTKCWQQSGMNIQNCFWIDLEHHQSGQFPERTVSMTLIKSGGICFRYPAKRIKSTLCSSSRVSVIDALSPLWG